MKKAYLINFLSQVTDKIVMKRIGLLLFISLLAQPSFGWDMEQKIAHSRNLVNQKMTRGEECYQQIDRDKHKRLKLFIRNQRDRDMRSDPYKLAKNTDYLVYDHGYVAMNYMFDGMECKRLNIRRGNFQRAISDYDLGRFFPGNIKKSREFSVDLILAMTIYTIRSATNCENLRQASEDGQLARHLTAFAKMTNTDDIFDAGFPEVQAAMMEVWEEVKDSKHCHNLKRQFETGRYKKVDLDHKSIKLLNEKVFDAIMRSYKPRPIDMITEASCKE